jgi:hypothetical protein
VQVLVEQKNAGHQGIEKLDALNLNRVQPEFSGQSGIPLGGKWR